MSAVFGEILTFGQANDRDIQLEVTGDEFYATYWTLTAVSDSDRGFLCYAALVNGVLVSSGAPYIGDLIVELAGPGGAKATLHNRTGAGTDNLGTSYDSASLAALAVFIWQGVQGDWVLNVRDVAEQDVGKLNRWSLEFLLEDGAQSVRGEATPNLQIPDNNPAGVSSTNAVARPGSVGRVKVSIDITHTYVGDLRIELVSPAGRSVVLHSQLGGGQDNLVVAYDSAAPLSPLSSLIGQPMQGNWILRVADLAAVDVGTLNQVELGIDTGELSEPCRSSPQP